MVRTFAACGLHRGDIIQNAYGYGLFTGGLGAHYGAEALGATVIPISGGNTDRQIMVMKDFGVTAICCTPSYFLHLLERAEEIGRGLLGLPLRAGVFGAEPWTEAMRRRIEADSGIKAYDIYGLSEIIGPGVASECQRQDGLHIFEDHFYPEIIDPKTGAAAAGRRGGRAGAHHAHQAGHADDPLPHARHHRASPPSPAPAAARSGASAASPAAPTTCSSSAASTSSRRRSRRRCSRSRAPCRTTRSS